LDNGHHDSHEKISTCSIFHQYFVDDRDRTSLVRIHGRDEE
jgi:hypothetical protein